MTITKEVFTLFLFIIAQGGAFLYGYGALKNRVQTLEAEKERARANAESERLRRREIENQMFDRLEDLALKINTVITKMDSMESTVEKIEQQHEKGA